MKNYEDIKIKDITIKNRLILPPMASGTPSTEHEVTDETVSYYERIARSGHLGLIIVEHAFVSPEGAASRHQLSISRDSDIEGLKRIVDIVHDYDIPVAAQINHAGGVIRPIRTGLDNIGPSKNTGQEYFEPDKAMNTDDIKRVVEDFASAAKRAKTAGFDAIEIHSAHGYILNQFYSPLTNLRTDEYGGSLENRIRIHVEVIRAIRETIGDDFPLFIRLGASDYMDGGNTVEDGVRASIIFEKEGIDLIDVSGGLCFYKRPGMEDEEGYFHDASGAIKEKVSLPVILTGGIRKISFAEKMIDEKQADLIGIGRPILNDQEWLAKKFMEDMEA